MMPFCAQFYLCWELNLRPHAFSNCTFVPPPSLKFFKAVFLRRTISFFVFQLFEGISTPSGVHSYNPDLQYPSILSPELAYDTCCSLLSSSPIHYILQVFPLVCRVSPRSAGFPTGLQGLQGFPPVCKLSSLMQFFFSFTWDWCFTILSCSPIQTESLLLPDFHCYRQHHIDSAYINIFKDVFKKRSLW